MNKKSILAQLLLEYYGMIIDDFNRISKINDLINNNIHLFTQTQIASHLSNLQNPNYIESIEKYSQSKGNALPKDFFTISHKTRN